MTITAERPVWSGPMTDEPIPEEPNILDRTAVGKLIGNGVTGETVKQYQKASKPEGRYARDPFPEPDGVFNGAPYWLASKSDKIREWDARRQRPGVGGRPRS